MTPFLKQVACFCAGEPGLENRLFIFPNRRSMVFFRRYLCEALPGRVTLLPQMTTVSDFYASVSGKAPSDRIGLLVTLYDCYRKLNPKAESLDDFIYWGGVILSDFDDVDKYMVDAGGLFANIADLSDIRDNYSYANERQKAAIEKLGIHFSDVNWTGRREWEKGGEGNRDAKGEFLTIWNLLFPLYEMFGARLSEEGGAYSGMIYRELASDPGLHDKLGQTYPEVSVFAFVGLNAISESERMTMKRMRDAGLAEFYWDYGCGMFKGPGCIGNRFMEKNVSDFPGRFIPQADGVPAFHAVEVPSSTGQAKLLGTIMEGLPDDALGLDFAVVLSDEKMLSTVLPEIPDRVGKVNVTMGYPLSSSEWASFMKDIMNLQLDARCGKDGVWRFYHVRVRDVLSSGMVRNLLDEEGAGKVAELLSRGEIYIGAGEFAGIPPLSTVFSNVRADGSVDAFADYLLGVTEMVASRLDGEDSLQQEFALMYWKCVNRLKGLHVEVQLKTWARLLEQLAAGYSVPFEGEPLGGLQIMGPLETRALDFRNIVIMSANEGVFPRRSVTPSFIPPSLREGFGLPTYRNQDAVWEYYFYRLLGRAENVWMIWDSRTDGLVTGEESRFVQQVRFLFPDRVKFSMSRAEAQVESCSDTDLQPKTEEDIAAIRSAVLSASSVEGYINCPMQFWFSVVKGLRPEDEISENMDAGLMGDVCHDTLHALYTSEEAMLSDKPFDKRDEGEEWPEPWTITRKYLEGWLSREDGIRRKVRSLICAKLHQQEVSGRDLVTAEVAVRYVRQVVRSDIRLMNDAGLDSFTVLALEKLLYADVCAHRFKGYVDRIDTLTGDSVRIVDYKTGSDRQECLAPGFKLSDIMRPGGAKAALQFLLYDRLVSSDPKFGGCRVQNSMYAMSDIFTGKVEVWPGFPSEGCELETALSDMLAQMEDMNRPFTRTTAPGGCRFCKFKVLCGKKDE